MVLQPLSDANWPTAGRARFNRRRHLVLGSSQVQSHFSCLLSEKKYRACQCSAACLCSMHSDFYVIREEVTPKQPSRGYKFRTTLTQSCTSFDEFRAVSCVPLHQGLCYLIICLCLLSTSAKRSGESTVTCARTARQSVKLREPAYTFSQHPTSTPPTRRSVSLAASRSVARHRPATIKITKI